MVRRHFAPINDDDETLERGDDDVVDDAIRDAGVRVRVRRVHRSRERDGDVVSVHHEDDDDVPRGQKTKRF